MEIAERLAWHERLYHGFAGKLERRGCGDFLYSETLPAYRDANHAALLRLESERGQTRTTPEAVASEVVSYYTGRHRRVVADVDEVAERQGIGSALRRRGVLPVVGAIRLMHYPLTEPPVLVERGIQVEEILPDSLEAVRQEWIEAQVSDEDDPIEAKMWRGVAEAESRFPACRLWLARVDGVAAGACSLFSAEGWGRVDSVVTRPEFRRRGVASAVVAVAVSASLSAKNTETYLTTQPDGAGEAVYRKLGFVTWAVALPHRHMGS